MRNLSASLARVVLIVDDDEDIRDTLLEVLTEHGYRAVATESAERALEILPALERPCLVLLDHVMSGIGGEGFLRAVAARPDAGDFPVLVMSANTHVAAGSSPEIVGALQKPFELQALLEALAQHCGPARART